MGCEEPHQRERGQEHIQPKNGIVGKLFRGIEPTNLIKKSIQLTLEFTK